MQKIIFVLASGLLLFFSFPPFEYEFLAWAALFPLIYLSLVSKPAESFRCGLSAGIVFWLSSIFWLSKVTYLGWFLVSLYCAFYFGLFAFVVSWWWNLFGDLETSKVERSTSNIGRTDFGSKLSALGGSASGGKVGCWMLKVSGSCRSLLFLFGIPAIWVGLEYVRSTFMTGFPWNLLGVSQYKNISLIQCAEWGGVYLVSYLIVMCNAAVALLYENVKVALSENTVGASLDDALPKGSDPFGKLRANERSPYLEHSCGLWSPNLLYSFRSAVPVLVFFLVIAAVLAFGCRRQNALPEITQSINVAGIQLNVPQENKWSLAAMNDIYYRLKEATQKAGRARPLDLIVWPETSLPDFVRYSGPSRTIVNGCLRPDPERGRGGVPILAGSMDYEESDRQTNYFNSSLLYLPGGDEPQIYAKRHLVPFGEYVPLGNYLPFLRSIADAEDDFTAGTSNVVFRLDTGKNFSVLICFEDTLPYLARDCVLAGARLLINQTNDAWFDPYWACYQHMAHCVFRCVENRVACLRVTNTGLTCLIDRSGKIRSELEPLRGNWRSPDILRTRVDFSPEKMPLTFYTRHGDLFALACLAFTLPILAGCVINAYWRRR